MDQLVEGVLAVCSRFAEIDWTGFTGYSVSIERHLLPEAFHRQLLQVGGETFHVMLVRQYRNRLRSEEIVVPEGQKTHQDRQVAFERRCPEVFVHLLETAQ